MVSQFYHETIIMQGFPSYVRYEGQIIWKKKFIFLCNLLGQTTETGLTGVQDGRVPSKSAQMSMPQNPMKFELEVPGML